MLVEENLESPKRKKSMKKKKNDVKMIKTFF